MDERPDFYKLPIRYTPIIEHFFKKGDFKYLEFDGDRFLLPYVKVVDFYNDLRSKLPKGKLTKKAIDRSAGLWVKWRQMIVNDDPYMDLSEAEEELTPDEMSSIISGKIKFDMPDFSKGIDGGKKAGKKVAEKMGEVDWKKVALIILLILFILFILGIIITLACAGGGDNLDLGCFSGFDGSIIDGIFGSGKKEEEATRRMYR